MRFTVFGPPLRLLLVVVVAAASIPPHASATPGQKRVLVLYSTRRDTQIATVGDREMPRLLEGGLGAKVDYYSEYIDAARFPDEQYEIAFRNYLRLKYSGSRFDVVVASRSLALKFLNTYRDELFDGTPIVYLSEDRSIPRPPNSAGTLAEVNYGATLTLAMRLQPDVQDVLVVVGSSKSDRTIEAAARRQFAAFSPRLAFTYSSNLRIEELERRVAALGDNTIVYYLLFYQDAAGVNVNPLEYLDRLSAMANRPIYSWVDSTLNHGVVGGSLNSIDSQVAALAALAIRVLRGESADSLPLFTSDLSVNQVDWRQLQRWHLSEDRAPAGTIIRFREASAWQRYRIYIVAVVVLLVGQAALIAGLAAQRSRRRNAEDQVRRSEADLRESYGRIRDLCSRLFAAQEAERSRIARELHDDVSQQVALLAMDLDLLGQIRDLDARADTLAHDARERVDSIANSVRVLSHRLHPPKLRLTGLVPALAGLSRELLQSGIAITFTHENVPPGLSEDIALCIYRIVQEAVQNAIKHSAARQIAMELRGNRQDLTLVIGDNGRGFDVDAAWGKGLGLVSMVERLEPFGGVMTIQSAPGHGTRLQIVLPLQAATGSHNVAV